MSEPGGGGAVIRTADIDAVIFDMDGVVTDTASVHAAAWKQLFDEFLADRAAKEGTEFVPFDADEDYLRDIDGKPRYDGVRDFLASRRVVLPESDVRALGNKKDGFFLGRLHRDGARAYESTVDLVKQLHTAGLRTAVISASRNMNEVLASAGLADLFEVRVDGLIADELHIPGKPDPAVFLEAARRLGVAPPKAAVVEDARAGVEAGRAGGFGWVIGVDRRGFPEALAGAGADVVVQDLAEVRLV